MYTYTHLTHVCLYRSGRDTPTFPKPCVPSSWGSKVDHVKPATGTILLGSIEASPEENVPIGVFLAVSMAALNTGYMLVPSGVLDGGLTNGKWWVHQE